MRIRDHGAWVIKAQVVLFGEGSVGSLCLDGCMPAGDVFGSGEMVLSHHAAVCETKSLAKEMEKT